MWWLIIGLHLHVVGFQRSTGQWMEEEGILSTTEMDQIKDPSASTQDASSNHVKNNDNTISQESIKSKIFNEDIEAQNQALIEIQENNQEQKK